MIERVTFTGIDEQTDFSRVVDISRRFPFVEWGVLVSRSQTGGSRRFPNTKEVFNFGKNGKIENLNMSLHLCGSYVRHLLAGKTEFIHDSLYLFWEYFQRVQINTHGDPHAYVPEFVNVLVDNWNDKEFIFQYDNVNKKPVHDAMKAGLKCSALFDLSHGYGVLPEEWPELIEGVKCGYAGGLSPENVEGQIEIINGIVGETPTWIDMETKVRTEEEWLDLDKVEAVCEIAAKYISS